ncbi:MAG: biopolymer transporter ExbD [Prevotella sp.]|nr:biopolymer transporter ExbD [Bacteroides sp.]MCM1365704.1 biopolymer transporter ExbD [Prevotella sp.]MCM1436374.1 biopolymer transporter ExbD [Prevotella sp.]
MALKRQFPALSTFSMSSMTDVIFLLLIFFMVTSTIIFPTALEVNLPKSTAQTDLKPVTEVVLDSIGNLTIVADRNDTLRSEPKPVTIENLADELSRLQRGDSVQQAVALYADRSVRYEKVIDILDLAARNNIKMVLATKAPQSQQPSPSTVKSIETEIINEQ